MVSGSEATDSANSAKRKNQSKTTKSKILIKSKNHDFPCKSRTKEAKTCFLIPEAKLAFTQLRQALVEALILYDFNPKSHIQIETNVSGYAIGKVLS